ncbi:Nucleolar protein 9 [Blastocladiella emersonii ATCC 22665]|nr:Nucleolar protein 9 [Blastocladiella emersonii ATCC 22665]
MDQDSRRQRGGGGRGGRNDGGRSLARQRNDGGRSLARERNDGGRSQAAVSKQEQHSDAPVTQDHSRGDSESPAPTQKFQDFARPSDDGGRGSHHQQQRGGHHDGGFRGGRGGGGRGRGGFRDDFGGSSSRGGRGGFRDDGGRSARGGFRGGREDFGGRREEFGGRREEFGGRREFEDRSGAPSPAPGTDGEDGPATREVVDFGMVPHETRTYFKSIEGRMDLNEWDSQEDIDVFLNNVYEEVHGKELMLATDAECSLVMEKLLRLSSDVHLRIFLDKLSGNYVNLFKHFCASHVCQTMLIMAADVLEREANGTSPSDAPEGLPTMTELIVTMCQQLRTFWMTLAMDRHATFLVRVALSVLRGQPVQMSALRSKKAKAWGERNNKGSAAAVVGPNSRGAAALGTTATPKLRAIPDALNPVRDEVLVEMLAALVPHVRTYAFNPVVNPILQQLVEIADDKDAIIARLLMRSADDDAIPDTQRAAYVENLVSHNVASRLFEKILEFCSTKMYHTLYTAHFRGRLADLCRNASANFVVQQLISRAKSEVQMDLLLDELAPEFDALLFRGRPLVLVHFLELAHRFQNYRKVLKPLYAAIACKRPKDILPTLLYLNRNYPGRDDGSMAQQQQEDGEGDVEMADADADAEQQEEQQQQRTGRNRVRMRPGRGGRHGGHRDDQGYHHNAGPYVPSLAAAGNQIVASILRMPTAHNKEVVDSFLANPLPLFHPLLLDPVASFTFQTFLTSPTVNVPPKRKLLFSLLNHTSDIDLATLAADKFGSHLVDAFWRVADLDAKEKMALDLLAHEKKVTESHHGRLVWRNCGMAGFKAQREEWLNKQQGIDRKRDMFKEFLADVDDAKELAVLGVQDEGREEEEAAKPKLALATVRRDDEIDEVFKRKVKKGPTVDDVEYAPTEAVPAKPRDKNMAEVLAAIENTKRKKKAKSKKREREADSDDEDARKQSKAAKKLAKKAKRQFAS